MHGLRARLTVTLVALVALTAGLLALGAYVFVDTRLHDQTRDDAANQARFDLTVLIPRSGMPADATADDIVASGVLGTLHQRGIETIVARGGEELARSSTVLEGALTTLPADLTTRVANGELAYAWTDVAGQPSLVVGGRLEPDGPDFYFVHDATELERALSQLRIALAAGFVAAVVVALVVARSVARGVLAPVEAAGHAAERIAQGDLTARVPVSSDDEFGQWARRFNEMADIQAGTIGQLETAEAQNRRFVADVAHELRTPVAALVAEASILREHLAGLPADSRRAAELLVLDVARPRALVEDLMEISRFDARAEQVETRAVDVAALVRSVAAARLPAARVVVPEAPVIIEFGRSSPRADRREPARQRARACGGRARRRYVDLGGQTSSSRSPTAAPVWPPTGLPTSSSASTRPIPRATAVAADWVSRSRRNMPPCSAGR